MARMDTDLDPRERYDLAARRGGEIVHDFGLTAEDAGTYRDILTQQGYDVRLGIHRRAVITHAA